MGRKGITHEEFIRKVFDLVGDDYEVLGVYESSSTKIEMKHKCGHIYYVRPNSFLRGSRCPECSKKDRSKKLIKTIEQYKKEVFDLVGNDYEVLGSYKGADTKIEMKHTICGHKYFVAATKFLSGCRCPLCGKFDKSKAHEKFLKKVYDLVGDDYEVLGTYENSITKIEIKHNKCGEILFITPSKFFNNLRCPKCEQQYRTKTHEEFVKEVYDLVGDDYKVLGAYVNAKTHIRMRHDKCGCEYDVLPKDFLNRGNRCPKCKKNNEPKSHEQFVKDSLELIGDEYEIIGTYVNNRTKIEVKHICGHKYFVNAGMFLQGSGCPRCSKKVSKGEKKIDKILLSTWGIGCLHEVTFDNCRGLKGGLLPFDIQPLVNKSLLIEYDGEQHSEPVKFGKISEEESNEIFIRTQKHDAIKDAYCLKEDIPLLRIKYYQFKDIKKLLREFLIENGVIDQNDNLILVPAA